MIILATLHDFSDALIHLAGFVFVLFVLSLLWVLLEAVGAFFRARDKRPVMAVASAPAAVTSVPASSDQGIPEEEVVVIASAVAMLLGKRAHRIVSIRSSGLDWSREGRRQLLQSHRVQK
ncbi:MAG: OadG family protein [Puniceicoccaceae bacterium]